MAGSVSGTDAAAWSDRGRRKQYHRELRTDGVHLGLEMTGIRAIDKHFLTLPVSEQKIMRSTDRAFTEIERASIERRFFPQQHSPSTSSLVLRRTAAEEDGTAGSPAAVTLDGPGTGDRGSD